MNQTAMRRVGRVLSLGAATFLDGGTALGKSHASDAPGASDELVGYYPFNGTAQDVSGNDHDGQIVGSVVPAPDRSGRRRKACFFSGTNSFVTVPAFRLPMTNQFTLSAWFSAELGAPFNDYRVMTFVSGDRQIALGMIQSPVPNGQISSLMTHFQTSESHDLWSPVCIEYGRWYLYTVTCDGAFL